MKTSHKGDELINLKKGEGHKSGTYEYTNMWKKKKNYLGPCLRQVYKCGRVKTVYVYSYLEMTKYISMLIKLICVRGYSGPD
jgi:hypothetical protein